MSASSYQNGTVSVGASATEIVETGDQNDGVLIQNRGPVSVYLGGSEVTASNGADGGILLAPGEQITVSTTGGTNHSLYGITAGSTAYVAFLQVAGE